MNSEIKLLTPRPCALCRQLTRLRVTLVPGRDDLLAAKRDAGGPMLFVIAVCEAHDLGDSDGAKLIELVEPLASVSIIRDVAAEIVARAAAGNRFVFR